MSAVVLEMLKTEVVFFVVVCCVVIGFFRRVVGECDRRGVWKDGDVSDWKSFVHAPESHLIAVAKATWANLGTH